MLQLSENEILPQEWVSPCHHRASSRISHTYIHIKPILSATLKLAACEVQGVMGRLADEHTTNCVAPLKPRSRLHNCPPRAQAHLLPIPISGFNAKILTDESSSMIPTAPLCYR